MIRQLGIAVSFLMLAGCAEQAVEENEGAEQLPEIPPLTYTWSHPDCPFTVDFPGEPVVEVGRTDQGVVSIHAIYDIGIPAFAVVCDAYVLNAFPNVEDYTMYQLAELYAEDITLANEFENAVLTPIAQTSFVDIPGAVLHYSVSTSRKDDRTKINTIVVNVGPSMADLVFSYESTAYVENAGGEFFRSLRLKTGN